jgi:zinc transport system substrate-binding protein
MFYRRRLLRLFIGVSLGLCIAVAGFAGGSAEDAPDEDGIKVTVSILPQKYFVERVGRDAVHVSVLVPPGSSPHTYDPTPRQVAALSESRALFLIGETFEDAFVPGIEKNLPDLMIVRTYENVRFRPFDQSVDGHTHHDHDEADHDEADHDDHDHERDTHIWLGPLEVKTQARTIRDALIRLDPDREAFFRKNFDDFAEDIDRLHAELKEILEPVQGKTMLVYHGAFGYFADAYNLAQVAVETGGTEPTVRQIEALIEKARAEGAGVIFVQPEFPTTSAQAIASAIDGAVVPVNPLAPDWLDNMRLIAESLRAGLE